jgi:putative heme transporter
VSAALIAAAFGFALPHVASYRSVWASLQAMTWPHATLVATAAAASMIAYWITIRAVLPWIRMRQAAAVSLGSNAVANALPAGGALAMGVSWAMLSSWGLSTSGYVLYTLVTGIWNVFTLLGLPVVALLVLTTAIRPDAVLITAAAVGLALLAAMACGLGLLLHSRAFALRAGRALQRPLAIAARLARRPPPADVAGALSGFRDRAGALLTARGWRITAAIVASYLMLWLVLLACLRAVGLSQTQVPWQTSLAALAFVRLLTALPITPGGLGITELGLVGVLAAGADHAVSVQVTAAVLLYRAVTYLPPIPLGALACLIWRHAPALISTSRRVPVAPARTPVTAPSSPQRTSQPDDAATSNRADIVLPNAPAHPLASPATQLASVWADTGAGDGGARCDSRRVTVIEGLRPDGGPPRGGE